MIGNPAALFLLALGIANAADDVKLVDSHTGLGYRRERLLVPVNQLTFEWARRKSIDLLAQNREHGVHVARFCADLADCQTPDRPTHVGYDGIVKLSTLSTTGSFAEAKPLAELVAVGENAVLRFRYQRGDYRQTVLRGQDPLLFEASGAAIRIVHLQYWVPLVGDGPTNGNNEFLDVFCQVEGTLTREVATAAFGILKSVFPSEALKAFFRTDGRFVMDDRFPWTEEFRNGLPFASYSVYQREASLSCQLANDSVSCSGKPEALIRPPVPDGTRR